MSKNKPGSFVLHHGSGADFKFPKWNAGDRHRDFGQCFYTTYDLDLATIWAQQKSINPKVYHYCVSLKSMKDCQLNIKRFEANEEWARFIYNNRYNENYSRPSYDVIVGPIADNNLTQIFAKMDLDGETFDDIAPLLKYEKFEHNQYQVCFCSEKALQLLSPVTLTR